MNFLNILDCRYCGGKIIIPNENIKFTEDEHFCLKILIRKIMMEAQDNVHMINDCPVIKRYKYSENCNSDIIIIKLKKMSIKNNLEHFVANMMILTELIGNEYDESFNIEFNNYANDFAEKIKRLTIDKFIYKSQNNSIDWSADIDDDQ